MSYAGVVDRGFGQADTTSATPGWFTNPFTQCSALDVWLGDCLPGTAPTTTAEANAPYVCNSFESFFWPSSCASAASPTAGQGPIAPLAPVVATVDPDSGAVVMLTAAQQHALDLAAITNNASKTAGVDCSLWYNQLFNSACPCPSCNNYFMYAGAALALFFVLKAIK